jgi:hypothetical protein
MQTEVNGMSSQREFPNADDNTLSVSGESFDIVRAALSSDANNPIEWFSSNFMRANPQKFQMMYMTPMNCPLEAPEIITINDVSVHSQAHVKLLGITIDDKLTFDRHIDNLCRKASRQLNILRRFKNIFCHREVKLIFQSFIMSNFNYYQLLGIFVARRAL